jgi:hypothetical protein
VPHQRGQRSYAPFAVLLGAALVFMWVVVALTPAALEAVGLAQGYVCAKEVVVIVLGAVVAGVVIMFNARCRSE